MADKSERMRDLRVSKAQPVKTVATVPAWLELEYKLQSSLLLERLTCTFLADPDSAVWSCSVSALSPLVRVCSLD
jgi:hypothetical protein